jgi:hypothetical protein
MGNHKFRIGERLRFQASGLTSSQSGIYEVLALMPQERGAGFQYRLKSTVDNHQRVALEDALSRL